MARLNAPTKTNTFTKTKTHEGGVAWRPDNAAIELLFTAATTYVGEDTFYEKASDRLARLIDLTHKATKRNPKVVEDIVRQLRSDFKIRTASLVVACEYVAAGGPNPRKVIDSACQRPDEPGEILAYWAANYGRSNAKNTLRIPRGIKMGLGDAARRLYTQRNVLKYDTSSHGFRFGDVLELCHVNPVYAYVDDAGEEAEGNKSALFQYVLDNRHHNDGPEQLVSRYDDNRLEILKRNHYLAKLPESHRRAAMKGISSAVNFTLDDAGFTWERLSSWLPGGMDAEAWEHAIPVMGVLALVRNLRNFDEKSISKKARDLVIAKITDPDEVAKSRIFPYQVLTAYKEVRSDNWKLALNDTADLASGNLPKLDGSLLVIDTSSSMRGALSNKSTADRITVAGLQAASVARASRDCTIVIFGDTSRDITHEVRGRSVLGGAEYIHSTVGSVGHSTFGHSAIKAHFKPGKHTRAIIFTDDQMHDSIDPHDKNVYGSWSRGWGYSHRESDISHVPQVITFNVGGYAGQATKGKGRITVAGFSDQIFGAVAKILQLETSNPTGTTI